MKLLNLLLALALASLLPSCISPADQHQNVLDPKAAELTTHHSPFLSAAYGKGVMVNIVEIDGKTTSGDFRAVPQPYRVSPGKHILGVNIYGSWSTYANGFMMMETKARQKYVLRGKHIGQVFVLEVVNTTSGSEVVEKSFRIMQDVRSAPMYVPIVVSS